MKKNFKTVIIGNWGRTLTCTLSYKSAACETLQRYLCAETPGG